MRRKTIWNFIIFALNGKMWKFAYFWYSVPSHLNIFEIIQFGKKKYISAIFLASKFISKIVTRLKTVELGILMCNKVYLFIKNLSPWFLAIPEIVKKYKSDQFWVKTFVFVFFSKDNRSSKKKRNGSGIFVSLELQQKPD